MIKIDVSAGELIDKLTILELKSERIADAAKLVNVRKELALLQAVVATDVPASPQLEELTRQLKAVNAQLWMIEDEIRACERDGDFGERFIDLARSVYRQNDRRAAVKREINELLGSAIVEEKSYEAY